ncbi:MAG: hypothetical protein CMJ31_15175, partial [Phycisphaerae bacterium]|nr:hypothetical protein [Phycisphaerae bacterium]
MLLAIVSACFLSLPWMLGGSDGGPRYNAGQIEHARIPPMWIPLDVETFQRLNQLVPSDAVERIAAAEGMEPEAVMLVTEGAVADRLRAEHPKFLLGADALGRSVFRRALVGGAVSLGVGIGASLISVVVGSLYGAVAGLAGGRVDAVMMRVVDVLYGLPYVLLVVLIAVASDAAIDDHVGRSREREAWLERQAAVDPAKATLEAAAVAVPARRLSAAAR